jgi:hypothetical protein
MGDEHARCDFCGARIDSTDFENGRSVVLFQKKYCNRCMDEAIERDRAKRSSQAVPRFRPPPPLPPPPDVRPAPPVTRRLKVGEHGCGLYGSEDERRAQVAPFIAEGLRSRAKVIHFMNAPTPARVLGDFRTAGLLVQPYLQSGQLEILPASKILGNPARFDPESMVNRLALAADHAIGTGYSGLRVATDMTWALSSLIEAGRLVEFETKLGSLVGCGKCAILCQFNVYRFEASSLNNIRTNHSVVFAKGTAESVLKEFAVSR